MQTGTNLSFSWYKFKDKKSVKLYSNWPSIPPKNTAVWNVWRTGFCKLHAFLEGTHFRTSFLVIKFAFTSCFGCTKIFFVTLKTSLMFRIVAYLCSSLSWIIFKDVDFCHVRFCRVLEDKLVPKRML